MKQDSDMTVKTRVAYGRLLVVLISSAIAVFGFLFRAMYVRGGEFDADAFEYWAPRAAAVVLVTTLLGLSVNRKGVSVQIAFGFLGGLAVAFGYLWITN
jgi:hypothetical protein